METDEDVKIVLYILAESVAARLRENGFRCRTVEINVRDKELFHFSKQVKLQNASNITKEIAEAGYRLYKDNYRLPADDKELKSSGQSSFKSSISSGIRSNGPNRRAAWADMGLCGYIRRGYFREQGICLY